MVFNKKFIFFFLFYGKSTYIIYIINTCFFDAKCKPFIQKVVVILKLIKTYYDIFVLYNLSTDVSTSPGVISNHYCSLLYSPTPANFERTYKDIFVAPQPTAAIFILFQLLFSILVSQPKSSLFSFIHSSEQTKKIKYWVSI